MSEENEVLYDVKDRIATVTLNRPDRMNSIDDSMPINIAKAMKQAATDPGVRAIILTGAGRAFCAGADIGRLQRRSGGERPPPPPDDTTTIPAITHGHGPDLGPEFADVRRYSYFMRIGKPVIGALNGATAGLGFIMALCCDMRMASSNMIFTTAFAQRGLIAEHGIAWLLPRLVGASRAMDLLLSSRILLGDEAGRIGLVDHVLPAGEVLPAALAYARDLAENCSPQSMAIIKRQVLAALESDVDTSRRQAVDLMLASFATADSREGVLSHLEKRPPRFDALDPDTV